MTIETPVNQNLGTHTEHGGEEPSEGSMRGYLIGFALSVVLTAIPFWLVMTGYVASPSARAAIVMIIAAVQIIVHMVYFLHMNTRSEGGWNVMALAFTVVILTIALSGSVWVMHHLNTNMMPVSADMMRNMP